MDDTQPSPAPPNLSPGAEIIGVITGLSAILLDELTRTLPVGRPFFLAQIGSILVLAALRDGGDATGSLDRHSPPAGYRRGCPLGFEGRTRRGLGGRCGVLCQCPDSHTLGELHRRRVCGNGAAVGHLFCFSCRYSAFGVPRTGRGKPKRNFTGMRPRRKKFFPACGFGYSLPPPPTSNFRHPASFLGPWHRNLLASHPTGLQPHRPTVASLSGPTAFAHSRPRVQTGSCGDGYGPHTRLHNEWVENEAWHRLVSKIPC